MKKALTVLVAVLVLSFALGCVAYADEGGYFDPSYGYTEQDIIDQGWEIVRWDPRPTCTAGGIAWARMDADDDPEPVNVEPLGHDWDLTKVGDDGEPADEYGWYLVVDEDATCTSEGSMHYQRVCTRCGLVEKGESMPVPFLQHLYNADDSWFLLVAPTCAEGEDGLMINCCALCGAINPDAEPVPVLDPADPDYEDLKYDLHDWGQWTTKIAATCTTGGYEVRYCNYCRLQEDRETPELGHDFQFVGEPERVNCFTYSMNKKCTRCGMDDPGNPYEFPYENPVHRYDLDWELTEEPTCTETGLWERTCMECGRVDTRVEPALGHVFDDRIVRTAVDGDTYFHWIFCDRCGDAFDPATPEEVMDNEALILLRDPDYETGLYHDWNDWICYVEPVEGVTLGHWYRTCKIMGDEDFGDPNCLEREEFVGTQEEFDNMVNPPEPPVPPMKNGLVWTIEEGVPVCRLYENDEVVDFTGMYLYDGGLFYLVGGELQQINGARLVGEVWYFLAGGQAQTQYTGLTEYADEWFYVEEGIINTELSGLVDYNGGIFLVGVGRIQKEVSTLYEDENGDWWYIALGQVQTDYTGLAMYDGEWFYIENGMLVPMNGEVEYDGGLFEVANGQVVAQIA
ncbi:MAG: hypothetical protein K6C08_16260 [Oscillospiraceae bacterium]|nr:hypothetical protein [Oscillospiraceae bacterium]